MGYTALAAVQAYHDWDFAAAERTLRQGIDAFPETERSHMFASRCCWRQLAACRKR